MVQNVKPLLDLTRQVINSVLLTFSRKALYVRAIHTLGILESQLYAPGFTIFSLQNLGCQLQTNQAHPMLSCFSHVWLFATLWTIASLAPLSMGFSRQEYWSGLPFPPARHLPDPGIEPASPVSPALGGRFFTTSATWEALSTSPWRPNAFGSGRCIWD